MLGSSDSQSLGVFDFSIEELVEIGYQVLWRTLLYDVAAGKTGNLKIHYRENYCAGWKQLEAENSGPCGPVNLKSGGRSNFIFNLLI